MKIQHILIKDILSIHRARFDVKETGLTLIDGWNHDDDSANGAGKTSIFNALSFCLYNKIPRKITVSEVLRKGAKRGHVTAVVEKDGDIWEITRGRPKLFNVKKNGQDVDISQDELESSLGISYLQFLISMYSAQTDSSKLINLNDTQKKDFFLQLLDLSVFSNMKKEADVVIKSLKFEMSELEKELVGVVSAIKASKEMFTDLDPLNKKIQEYDELDLLNQYDHLKSIPAPDLSKYDSLSAKIVEKRRTIDMARFEADALKKELEISNETLIACEKYIPVLPNAVTCPHCSQGFGLHRGSEVTEEDMRKDHEIKTQEVRDNNNRLKAKVAELPDFTEQYSKLDQISTGIRDKKNKEYADYNSAIAGLTEVSDKLASLKHDKCVLEMAVMRNSDIEGRIAESKASIDIIKRKYSEKKEDLQVYEEISQMVSPTGAPAYIMDSIIEAFNDKMAGFVSLIWPRAIYRLQAHKENKAGDIKAKFSENLVIDGEARSIGGLSGGEQKCLSLAMDFAVIEILQSVFGTKLNPIIMDEPFDSLDSSNKERVIELLEKLSVDRNIIVIDHASEAKSMFSDIIKIEKRNGISEIN